MRYNYIKGMTGSRAPKRDNALEAKIKATLSYSIDSATSWKFEIKVGDENTRRDFSEYMERYSKRINKTYEDNDEYFRFLYAYSNEDLLKRVYRISRRYKDSKFYEIGADYYVYLGFIKVLLENNLNLTKSRFQRMFGANLDKLTEKLIGELK